jgi:hypothetical protein
MNVYRMGHPPRRWQPRLSPTLFKLLHKFRLWFSQKEAKLTHYEIEGTEIVREARDAGNGVLITPNHPTHADPYAMNEAASKVGYPFYFMATWNVFDVQGRIVQWLLQKHGVFSVDREGTDVVALKTARNILEERDHPLVIFPEGEVYLCNDIVTPFREGAAAVGLMSARSNKRPIVCIPCALKYRYTKDPMPELLSLMEEVENAIHWQPRPDKDIVERIHAVGSALMALKEVEFLDSARNGSLNERTNHLANYILAKHEKDQDINCGEKDIPERVKELRRRALKAIKKIEEEDAQSRATIDRKLHDYLTVVQLFSYPGNYLTKDPSVERIAETLDKFEEDILRRQPSTVRGERMVKIRFGEPITVSPEKKKGAARELTDLLENRVQELLDSM